MVIRLMIGDGNIRDGNNQWNVAQVLSAGFLEVFVVFPVILCLCPSVVDVINVSRWKLVFYSKQESNLHPQMIFPALLSGKSGIWAAHAPVSFRYVFPLTFSSGPFRASSNPAPTFSIHSPPQSLRMKLVSGGSRFRERCVLWFDLICAGEQSRVILHRAAIRPAPPRFKGQKPLSASLLFDLSVWRNLSCLWWRDGGRPQRHLMKRSTFTLGSSLRMRCSSGWRTWALTAKTDSLQLKNTW